MSALPSGCPATAKMQCSSRGACQPYHPEAELVSLAHHSSADMQCQRAASATEIDLWSHGNCTTWNPCLHRHFWWSLRALYWPVHGAKAAWTAKCTQNMPAGRRMTQLIPKITQAAEADFAFTLHNPNTTICCHLSDEVALSGAPDVASSSIQTAEAHGAFSLHKVKHSIVLLPVCCAKSHLDEA